MEVNNANTSIDHQINIEHLRAEIKALRLKYQEAFASIQKAVALCSTITKDLLL